jgi:RNA polymerase sigma-70 factor, ECF subfamily
MGKHRLAAADRLTVASPDSLDLLIGRIADGDIEALATFYDRTASTVYAYAGCLATEEAMVDALAVDAYIRLWRTSPRFCPIREDVSTWIARVTADCAADRRRQPAAPTE